MMSAATFKLTSTKVASIALKQWGDTPADTDNVALRVSSVFHETNSRLFAIRFDMAIAEEGQFLLDIAYLAEFEANENLTEEFKQSNFPRVNAPAIAYPFLRAFVSTLTVNAGFDAVVLPTINFQALAAKKEEGSKKPS